MARSWPLLAFALFALQARAQVVSVSTAQAFVDALGTAPLIRVSEHLDLRDLSLPAVLTADVAIWVRGGSDCAVLMSGH